jgi:hypothetical protein
MDRAIVRQALAQPEIAKDKEDNHDEADKVNNLVHFFTLPRTVQDRTLMLVSFPQPNRSAARCDDSTAHFALLPVDQIANASLRVSVPSCTEFVPALLWSGAAKRGNAPVSALQNDEPNRERVS